MTDARLYLMTPALAEAEVEPFLSRFADALAAGDVASVLARATPGADVKRVLAPLMEIAAAHDAALVVEGDARLAARLGADGAHVPGAEVGEAARSLKPQRIVGAGRLRLRDDAMTAAEAGADYVMFGEPGATLSGEALGERVRWWAEIFETPCVAYAASLEEVAALAAAGADFIALGEAVFRAERPAEAVAQAMRAIGRGK